MAKNGRPETVLVQLSQIRIDGGTQSRAQLDEATVLDYATVYSDASKRKFPCDALPEMESVFDGSHYWLYDGFHRYHGAVKAGLKQVRIAFVFGSVKDARWLACAANQTHGLKRTNGDKRRAVEMAFASIESQGMSDRAISTHCGVSFALVADVRKGLSANGPLQEYCSQRTGLDGRKIDVTNIGKVSSVDSEDIPFGDESGESCAEAGEATTPENLEQTVSTIEQGRKKGKPKKGKPKKGKPEPAREEAHDALGNVVPPTLRDVFADQKMLEQIERVRSWRKSVEYRSAVKQVSAIAPYYGLWVNPLLLGQFLADAHAALVAAEQHLERCIPYALCPHCFETAGGCESCRNAGWVPKWRYDELLEQERLTGGKTPS